MHCESIFGYWGDLVRTDQHLSAEIFTGLVRVRGSPREDEAEGATGKDMHGTGQASRPETG